MRGPIRSRLLVSAAFFLLGSAPLLTGQQGGQPSGQQAQAAAAPAAAPDASPAAFSGQQSAQLDRIEGDLSPVRFTLLLAAAMSGLTLLAVLGLYLRAYKSTKAGELAAKAAPPQPPAGYDDRDLRAEIQALRQVIERMAQQVTAALPPAGSRVFGPQPPVTSSTPREDSFAGSASGASRAAGEVATLIKDYERTRPSRSAWKDFESRYACERFECTNVRERTARPEEPLRFETSPAGVYLAAAAPSGKLYVFPFFSASPVQLFHDGAMSEVYDFPTGSPGGALRVAQPAVFTRVDRQWFLQSRGRLEE